MGKKLREHSYMYRQGNGWIVCHWDNHFKSFVTSHEKPYSQARSEVGTANCRHPESCDKVTHYHPEV